MEPEVAVEVQCATSRAGPRNRDAGTFAIVERVAVRHHHVEPVHGAALEQANERLHAVCRSGAALYRVCGAGEEDGVQPERHECQASRLHEHAATNGQVGAGAIFTSHVSPLTLTVAETPANPAPDPPPSCGPAPEPNSPSAPG